MGTFFNLILVYPIINILVAVYTLFSFLHLPYALGFAIVGLTVVIRLIMYPLTTSQLQAAAKMQKMAPQLNKLKAKYKEDSAKIPEAKGWPGLLATMILRPAWACSRLPALEKAPEWFRADYAGWKLAVPKMFMAPGQADRFAHYWEDQLS